jgi:hypothetical protein
VAVTMVMRIGDIPGSVLSLAIRCRMTTTLRSGLGPAGPSGAAPLRRAQGLQGK